MKKILFLLTLLITATIVCIAEGSDDDLDPSKWKMKDNTDMYPDKNGGQTQGTKVSVHSEGAPWNDNKDKYIEGLSDGRVIRHEVIASNGVAYHLYTYCTTVPGKIIRIEWDTKYVEISNSDCLASSPSAGSSSQISIEVLEVYYDGGVVFIDLSTCKELKYCETKSPPAGTKITAVTTNGNGTAYVATSNGNIYSIEGGTWTLQGSVDGYVTAIGASGSTVLVTTASNSGYTNRISTNGGVSFNELSWGNFMEEWIGIIFENPANPGSFFFGGSAGILLEYDEYGNISKYNTGTNLGINSGAQLDPKDLLKDVKGLHSQAALEEAPLKSVMFLEEEEEVAKTAIFVGDKGLYLFAKSDGTLSEPKQIPGCNEGLKGVEASYVVTTDTISPTTLKKSVALVAYAWGETSLWSYNEAVDSAYYHLAVSEDTIEIPWTETNTITFDITSNVNWEITSGQSWLTIEPVSGNGDATVTLTAGANPTFDARTDTLTITGDEGLVQTVVITQAGAVPYISVSVDSLSISGTGGSGDGATFDVRSNKNWSVLSDQTWLLVNPILGTGNGTITVTAEKNPTVTERTAIVTVSADGVASQTVTVTQAAGAATLTVSPSTLEIGAEGGSTATYNVVSNTMWETTSDQSWLSADPANSADNGMVTVTAQANPTTSARTATVTVSATGVSSQTVLITQTAGEAYLSVSATVLNINASSGSSATFDVLSNTNWEVSSNQTWLVAEPISGMGDGVVGIVAEQNQTVAERIAILTVSATGVTSQTVTVTQAAGQATLTVSPSILEIGATDGSTAIFDVTSNTAWSVASDQSWLSVNPASGSGEGTVTLTAGANPSSAERFAIITVAANGAASQTVTVIQTKKVGMSIIDDECISVYPNPFSDGFYVNAGNLSTVVSIFDMGGRTILKRTIFSSQFIETGKVENGIYLIEITNAKQTIRKKMIRH